MFSRRTWVMAGLSALFILIIVLSSILSLAPKKTLPTQARAIEPKTDVPLSGSRSSQASSEAFSKTNIIISFIKGISAQERTMIEGMANAHEVRPLGVDNAYLATVPSGDVSKAISILNGRPGVRYAEPDYTQSVTATPNDPGFPTQWGFQNTGQTVKGTAGTPGADEDITPAWARRCGASSATAWCPTS